MTPLLALHHVSKRFGGLTAVDDVSMSIRRGEIYGLIGPNGASKTTCFNLITGLYRADEGEFHLQGQRYRPRAIDKVAQAGIARTFQNLRLFNEMSVLENVMVGCHVRTRNGLWAAIARHRRARGGRTGGARQGPCAAGVCRHRPIRPLPRRGSRLRPPAPSGDRPRAGDRAPAAGAGRTGGRHERRRKVALRELLLRIRDSGKTLLLIEHDVKLVMGLCDRLTVLDYGKAIAEGEPAQVRREPAVIQAYLGGGAHV